MKKINSELTAKINGGTWGDFMCGMAIGTAIVAPNPLTVIAAIGTCGWASER